jgi:PAS domain S-box-containing protein
MAVGAALAVLSWIFDVLVDVYFLGQGTLKQQFLSPAPMELSARFSILFIFLAFGVYLTVLMNGMKRSEAQLRDSEARYRDLFENANDLIQSVAADGSFQYVNRTWRETLGYSAAEIGSLRLLDVIHPDSRVHCMEVFKRIAAGEKIDRVEALFLTRDGKKITVEGSINCSRENGALAATRGIFRNITDHRKAEEFINSILENVDEGFIVLDRDFRISSVNKAYRSKLKLGPREIIGKHCYEVSHRRTRPCYEEGEDCAVQRTFETGEPYQAIHHHYDTEGKPIYIEIKSFPLKDAAGNTVSAIEIHNDITDRKRLEDQLRHAQKMEAVGTLAGGVAHDFNNILTAIFGYGSLLQMKMDKTDALRPMVDQILASTERAANLTQSLLSFSRKQVILPKLIDLNSIVRRVEQMLGRVIGEDISVSMALTGDAVTIKADAGQIEQVLMNLATNARDAMPRGGKLAIGTDIVTIDDAFIHIHGYGRTGRYVRLSASDTGFGMDKKTIERIFEPFFSTKEAGRGTGLGLAIVYGIVKQHGGYINVYSEPGAGSTFKVYLPLVASAVPEEKNADMALPPGGSATVLVAEDDDNVRRLSKSVLEGFGYTVIEALDGQDAIEKYQKNQSEIQLLILDVIMPRKSGKDVYNAVRAINPAIKVVFMSGYTADIIQSRGMLDEGLPFLSKPVSPKELLLQVAAILNGQAQAGIRKP